MTLPQRPIPQKLQAKVIRLRAAIKESRQIKKDYAVARGKNLLSFLRESAQADLNAVEVGFLEKLEAAGVDTTKYVEDLEEANSNLPTV